MTSHVDAETLALSAEGLLDGTEEHSVRAHVAACPQCADQQAALADVSRVLGEVEAPPLPDAVSAHLDDVLRAECEQRNGGRGDAPPTALAAAASDSGGAADDHDAEEAEEQSPEGGEDGEGNPNDTAAQLRRARAAASANQGEAADSNVVPLRPRSTRWMPYIAAAAGLVFVVGGGAAVMGGVLGGPTEAEHPPAADGDAGSNGETDPQAILPYHPVLVESETTYTDSGLPTEALQVLERSEAQLQSDGAEADQEATEDADPPAPQETPANLSSCIEGLSDGGDRQPALVDIADFSSGGADPQAAWVFYYPVAGEAYDVQVVDPECDAPDTEAAPGAAVLGEATVQGP